LCRGICCVALCDCVRAPHVHGKLEETSCFPLAPSSSSSLPLCPPSHTYAHNTAPVDRAGGTVRDLFQHISLCVFSASDLPAYHGSVLHGGSQLYLWRAPCSRADDLPILQRCGITHVLDLRESAECEPQGLPPFAAARCARGMGPPRAWHPRDEGPATFTVERIPISDTEGAVDAMRAVVLRGVAWIGRFRIHECGGATHASRIEECKCAGRRTLSRVS